jgi:PleD family two-component response regulator
MGLAIVESLAEFHGGSVRAKSGGEGRGTTFVVSLPVSVVRTLDVRENRQHPGAERAGRSTHSPDLTGVAVMVVDDEPDACGLVRGIMEAGWAAVTTFCSGAECLAAVGGARPGVLMVDIGMSPMDGLTLLETLRTRPAGEGARRPRSR